MLCLVLLVFALTGRCRGDSDNSSTSPMLLLPPEPVSRRMSAAQVNALRRQLMRDNYDYQHSGDDRQTNITVTSGGDTKFYYQKGGTDHLPRASEFAQAKSNEFNAEHGQQEHYKQRGQNVQGGQGDQPGEYENRGQYEQPGAHELRGQYQQPGEHEQRGQYQQPGEHNQRGQYDQRDQYDQHGPHKQRGQREHHEQNKESEQREQRGQNEQLASYEQRGQNQQPEHSEQQDHLWRIDEQEQTQSIEQKPGAAPSLEDTLVAPRVSVPFTDELTMRDVFGHEFHRDIDPAQAKEYNPSYYNKPRDAYDPPFPAQMQRRPFSDLRGNYKEQYGQNDAGNVLRAQEELASNAQESPDQEYAPDKQEAFDQQDASGSQDDEGSDFSVSKKQPKIYNEFVTRSTTRTNRLKYYTPAPTVRNSPPHRVHNSLSYHDLNSPLHRNASPPQRKAPPPHHNEPPTHRNQPPPHRNAPDHNISKKDLLYYMDENQLRRRNNDASPDMPDEDQPADDQLPSSQPSPGPNNLAGTRTSPGKPARRPAPTEESSGGELPRTTRARRSFVVTVSAANVTYKLLTLKSRSGRRQHERRILEERGPGGVAIMSLDHEPLPAFRLPRARRQYMHAQHHHRRHEPA